MATYRMIFYFILMSAAFLPSFIRPADADIYRFKDKNGVWNFTNTRSDRRYKLYIRTNKLKGEQYIVRYENIINRASKKFGIDAQLIKAIIMAESSFNPYAISKSGAKGLMQLMPVTANDMRVENPFDPEDNILGGTKYLSMLLKRFNNDKKLALAAYNAGPKTVDDNNSIPQNPQVREFVDKVMRYYTEFQNKRK